MSVAKITEFFSAWAMDNAAERGHAIRASFATTGSYDDPRTEMLKGPDAVTDYVGMFTEAAPGAVAEVVKIESRAGVTRATIAFKMPNGMEQTGQYFIEQDENGLITRMIGFVGTGAPE